MEARINSLDNRMGRMEELLSILSKDIKIISDTGTRTEEGVKRINGNIVDLKIKDKQHDDEITILNKFKSGLTYIGAFMICVVGYVVQLITSK